jgi:hypothetical protein
MKRRNLLWAVTGGLVATALAGGIAYATIPGTGNVYTACMLKNVGTVRLIDKSLPDANPMSHCSRTLELEVSWNQRGQDGVSGTNGTNGRDVTTTFEPVGSNCAGAARTGPMAAMVSMWPAPSSPQVRTAQTVDRSSLP